MSIFDWPTKLLIGLFLLVIGLRVTRGDSSFSDYYALIHNRQTIEEAVAELRVKNDQLREEIVKIKTSKDYARKILRDKYHVLEDNERIMFFAE